MTPLEPTWPPPWEPRLDGNCALCGEEKIHNWEITTTRNARFWRCKNCGPPLTDDSLNWTPKPWPPEKDPVKQQSDIPAYAPIELRKGCASPLPGGGECGKQASWYIDYGESNLQKNAIGGMFRYTLRCKDHPPPGYALKEEPFSVEVVNPCDPPETELPLPVAGMWYTSSKNTGFIYHITQVEGDKTVYDAYDGEAGKLASRAHRSSSSRWQEIATVIDTPEWFNTGYPKLGSWWVHSDLKDEVAQLVKIDGSRLHWRTQSGSLGWQTLETWHSKLKPTEGPDKPVVGSWWVWHHTDRRVVSVKDGRITWHTKSFCSVEHWKKRRGAYLLCAAQEESLQCSSTPATAEQEAVSITNPSEEEEPMGTKSTHEEQQTFLLQFAEKKLRRQNSWYMKSFRWAAPKMALVSAGGGIWYVIANFTKLAAVLSGGSPVDDGFF